MNLSAYVASYVQDLMTEERKREKMVETLSRKEPFTETEFMAVVNILGRLSSEALSEAVGKYIGKIASIVLAHDGDIVKFLGDAILVTFSATNEQDDPVAICERALRCCSAILMDCESHDVDMKKWITPAIKRESNYDSVGTSGNDKTKTKLTLHAGVTAGSVTRVIVGIPSLRVDYYVSGDCFGDLKGLLDGTKSGQLGVSEAVMGLIPISGLLVARRKVNCILDACHIRELREQLSLCEFEKKGLTSLPHALVDPSTSNMALPDLNSSDNDSLLTIFINQSLVYRMRGYNRNGRSNSLTTSRAFGFQSEYRTLTVLFIKVLHLALPTEIQVLMEELLTVLKRYNGVFQQCSVDDKGQTLLSCFGLPPFGHEKCALLAVQAATTFLNAFDEKLATQLSVAVATGDVLFGTLGTEKRKEAGLLGNDIEQTSGIETSSDGAIRTLLKECGEDPFYASIVSEVILRRGAVKDGASTFRERRLEPEAKNSIVKALIVKMIAMMISRNSMVLLLDDAQWIDTASLEVIASVTELCPKFDENVKLKGLQHDEILNYFISYSGIKFVNSELIKAILEKTSGNLLQVDTVVKYLTENTSMIEKAKTQSELDDWKSLDSLLSTKIETVIMAQFDRLDPFLQVILKLASILGQYFFLPDIVFLLNDETVESDAVEMAIRRGDEFEFVQIEESSETNSFNFFFRHISIRNAIYESIALTERQRLHLIVAERYEQCVGESLDKTMAAMPLMCYHYWRSGDVKKMVLTNIDLGCILVDDRHYREGRNILYQVFDFLDTYEAEDVEPFGARSIHPPISSFLTPERLASALSKAAWSGTNVTDYSISQACAIKSLNLSGIAWPETEREAKSAVLKALMTLIARWTLTRGGMVDLHYGKSVEWHTTVKTCLSAMTLLANFHSAFQETHRALIIVWTFNHVILRCQSDPTSWFYTMTLYSYFLGRNARASKVCKLLTKRCRRIRKNCDESAKASFHIHGALLLGLLDSPRDALEVSRIGIRFWEDRKLPVERLKCCMMMFYSNVMVGEFNHLHQNVTVRLANEIRREDPLWTLSILVCLQLEAYATANLNQLQDWYQLAVPLARTFNSASRIPFGYIEGVPELLVTTLRLSECGSMEVLERILVVLHQVATQHLLENGFMIFFVTLVLYISVCGLKAKIEFDPLPQDQLHRLSKAITVAELATKKFSGFMLLTQIGYRLMQACSASEIYRIKTGRRPSSIVAWFKSFLNRPKFAGRLGEGGDYVTLGGVCCAVLGTLSTKEEERRVYSNRAAGLFRGLGAVLLERWASNAWL
ncbi:hypothetical protein HDU67_006965 [Dinochytrium kinnereticum]|nr:hypothetical protein HDU67_006965 [Dinochytrium kinnereticum]